MPFTIFYGIVRRMLISHDVNKNANNIEGLDIETFLCTHATEQLQLRAYEASVVFEEHNVNMIRDIPKCLEKCAKKLQAAIS